MLKDELLILDLPLSHCKGNSRYLMIEVSFSLKRRRIKHLLRPQE